MDSINNEKIYVICPNAEILNLVNNYFTSRSGEKIVISLVKSYSVKNLYRINTMGYDILRDKGKLSSWDGIKDNISLRNVDGRIVISGSLVNKNDNLFTQDVYLDIVDSQSEKHTAYYVV